ncbi:sensor histidine kinase [Pelagibacterium limicola]|uniref:sensor histidine kinase n=1 Tax=Pelagibacterium limicola TaxID=2791022 RepID=UPI0018AFE975|nr:HAMP domain-containing sensor histidine kinase [Pelagibacterium limicola]
MTDAWTSQPDAERAFTLAADPRPAWLWSGDGTRLLWHNHAATLFGAKAKNGTLKRAEAPVPIKGQIGRILRLGLAGRPMLSRMQFIAGRKPLSATCLCTPLAIGEDRPGLLITGVDPIAGEILAFDPIESPALEDAHDEEAPPSPPVTTDELEPAREGLGALVDRLAGDERLFAPLGDEEELDPLAQTMEAVPDRGPEDIATAADLPKRESDWDYPGSFSSEEQAFTDDTHADETPSRAGLWQLVGRGLTIAPVELPDEELPGAPKDESIEQVSRYNFEELARILHDRVGREAEEPSTESEPQPVIAEQPSNLVSLSDETLVLNRLPLGILIFRDQDILFANRALVDMTGYGNATMLRAVGLSAVIPVTEGNEPAGPVSQLLRRDGARVAVAARLNTVSWQGRSAVMLSARILEGIAGREDEIRRFAAQLAEIMGAGYVESDQIGIITATSGAADTLPSIAKPGERISQLVAVESLPALSGFLTLPARFAETERPAVALNGKVPGSSLTVFALGRAGVVTGYCALFERGRHSADQPSGLPAAALARIGRELRRPLNTVVGFSELIASESFGPVSNPRYLEYARDINAAGAVMTDLADELDDYVRLAEGKVELTPADIDLSALLADCLVRVRGQAGAERVLLRSAISERLPMVRADAGTLKQAILNMLASAINEAGEGNKVVVSAQQDSDGTVSVHVRDAARRPNILADHFVVFRDGQSRDGSARQPVRSSIGLTLTRTLVAVNACSLSLDPAAESGTLMTLTVPASLVVRRAENLS